MFDIGWSELLVVAAVAIVVVGPKDLPRMLRAVGHAVTRVKRAASEFQGHFEQAMREAELDELRDSVKEIGSIDPMAEPVKRAPIAAAVGADVPALPSSDTAMPDPAAPVSTMVAEPVPQTDAVAGEGAKP